MKYALGSVLTVVLVIAALVLLTVDRDATPVQAHTPGAITLTTISTAFTNPVGIDHYEPQNKVVISANYPNGQPHNFELVAANGTHSVFSAQSGFTDEVKIATVRSGPNQGCFTPGDLFVGTGTPGQIARISNGGATVTSAWATLTGEPGLMRGSLFQDRYGAFGGNLIAVTTNGGVWVVPCTGGTVAAPLANLGTHLEGLTTVPNNPAMYGPWAGKILAGAESQGRIYAIAPNGTSTFYTLGINPEDFDIIPANENFFGVSYGSSTLVGAPASQFAGMVGDVLITQELPGVLYDVHWDNASQTFHVSPIANVPQWEHVTFSSAGIVEIASIAPTASPSPTPVPVTASPTPVPLAPPECAGMAFDKILIGTNSGETIIGTQGRDLIITLGGNDYLSGQNGNDCLVGGSGNDTLIADAQDDVLVGGDGADYMSGGYGNDRLFAGGGDDNLYGAANTDHCDGGIGTDMANTCETIANVP